MIIKVYKIAPVVISVIAAILLIFFFLSKNENTNPAKKEEFSATPRAVFLEPHTNADGAVAVTVEPRNISEGSSIWEFKIILDTHSTELDKDLTAVAVLVDENGKEYKPVGWEGDPPGGHHREGILKFSPIVPLPKSIGLKIRDVGGIIERNFLWTISP